MSRIVIALVIGLFEISTAEAGYKEGNDIHRHCSQQESEFYTGVCLGYITGAVDVLSDAKFAGAFINDFEIGCWSIAEIELGQLIDIVKKYLVDHPEERHNIATLIVLSAIREAFPCSK
ncbi:MAG: hypothetical protein H8E36_00205 [Rhodospirillaceae bacterium]|nr:hypothetical protein [Rhodospirillaceae bacterium]